MMHYILSQESPGYSRITVNQELEKLAEDSPQWSGEEALSHLVCVASGLQEASTTTSRTEASHWLIKQDLDISAKDLLALLDNFEHAIIRQYAKIKTEISNDRERRPTRTLHSIFEPIANPVE